MTEFTTGDWVVHKFGGTSVGSSDCMKQCIQIIKPLIKNQRVAVVVSAMGGKPKVTDLLLDCVHAAAVGNAVEINKKMENIHMKHRLCVDEILQKAPKAAERILAQIESDLKDIADLLKAVTLMRTPHEQILELVSGYGEIWSASIMAEAMRCEDIPFIFVNARDVLLVSEGASGTSVHWEESEELMRNFVARADAEYLSSDLGLQKSKDSTVTLPHLMITGYIASTLNGIATTLKRDGSDFSASIFGKMLRASGITIWTDVSGVYSADPRKVPDAQIISEVSYTEAIELAYFGAKVIHPKTMAPAIANQIPIFIRNTFAPEEGGTRIFVPKARGELMREKCVCGFSTVDNISLLNLEGTGMIGVPGIAQRLFGALKSANISVMYIAQASSEHSICFATKSISTIAAKHAVEEAFFYELKQGLVTRVRVIEECSIIAAVGESMSNMPGVSGIFFGALGDARINVLSISQGCDERNISAVVYGKDATRALRAVHSAFWLSSLDVSIGIVGTGRVGSAVLSALIEQINMLSSRFNINLKLRGVANSKKMLLGTHLVEELESTIRRGSPDSVRQPVGGLRRANSNEFLQDISTAFHEDGPGKSNLDMDKFLTHVQSGHTPHLIIIDTTTAHEIAGLHPHWLKNGAHVVTANKRAISSSLDLYNAVYSAVKTNNRMYMSEVTIGAALPIQTTLNDLLCSGDAVHSIVGLMSVSAGVILSAVCEEGLSFSQAVEKTFTTGLFEDDVFVDLEGTEAAQKLLILGRELGCSMSIEDIFVEPLASRRKVDSWHDLSEVFAVEDIDMAKRARDAKAKGCTLRYVQRIECSTPAGFNTGESVQAKASVKLEEVPLDSAHGNVKGATYHFSFHTERYRQSPLIVQGPLSDSANTASGIVGDILRIARSIGAKDKGPEALSTNYRKQLLRTSSI